MASNVVVSVHILGLFKNYVIRIGGQEGGRSPKDYIKLQFRSTVKVVTMWIQGAPLSNLGQLFPFLPKKQDGKCRPKYN